MSKQLYWIGKGVSDELKHSLIADGVVVRIEIDMEAADAQAISEIAGTTGAYGGDSLWAEGSIDRVLDAALGLEDDDA